MAVNRRNPDKNIDLCLYRNDVHPVMAIFLVMARLTIFYIYNSGIVQVPPYSTIVQPFGVSSCIHFDGVVCLERTFINQDTKLFPGSG